MLIPLIGINSLLRDPAETNIHDIMPKLCLNPNYKQVLGELSQQVSTGSTPGHWACVGSYRVAKYYERILHIGWMTWCHKSLHLEKKYQLTQAKKEQIMQVNPLIF